MWGLGVNECVHSKPKLYQKEKEKPLTTPLVYRFAPERTQPPEYNAGKPVSLAFRVCLGAPITTSDDRKKSCTGALAIRVTPVSSPLQGGIKHVFPASSRLISLDADH